MLYAHIRGLSQYYVDGLERMEIVIDKKNASPLPYRDHVLKLSAMGGSHEDLQIRSLIF